MGWGGWEGRGGASNTTVYSSYTELRVGVTTKIRMHASKQIRVGYEVHNNKLCYDCEEKLTTMQKHKAVLTWLAI